jgi:hypothetical protein
MLFYGQRPQCGTPVIVNHVAGRVVAARERFETDATNVAFVAIVTARGQRQ